MVFSVAAGDPGAGQQGPYLFGRGVGEERLAHAGGVRQHPAADLGEHAHGVLGRHLGDVDDLVAVEEGHVRRLPGLLDQTGEVGAGPGTEQARRGLAEADQAGAEGVPSVGLLAYVAARHQRAHQAVDRGQRQTAGGGELAEADLAPCIGHAFEQVEGALEGLDATAGGGGLRGSVGGAGAGRRHGAVLSVLAGKGAAYPAVGVGPSVGVEAVAAGQRGFVRVVDVLGKLSARFPVVVATFWIVKS